MSKSRCSCIKGSVSRVLRWVLLYIIQKLFSRPIIASHKILTLLKGQFTIIKKQAGATLYYDMVLSRQYWNRRKMGVSAILKFATASLSDITEKYLYTILPVFLLVLWVHIAQMKAFSHSSMTETYCFCDIISLRGAVANFNIGQPTFTSAFNIVWAKPYHSTMMRLPVFW